MQARVLYRDGLMLVLDKPAGIPVHAGPQSARGRGPNLEYYFRHLQYGLPNPPALAHRLDRDTSGCLILGRHAKALRRLGKLFEAKRIEKTYLAVCVGSLPGATGTCALPLKKRANLKTSWWMEVADAADPEAMASITDWQVIDSAAGLSLVAFKPQTGRTHQIRVHAAALGCPLLGEPVYGTLPEAQRQVPIHLHALSISVPLYPAKPAIVVTAPLPAHITETLTANGLSCGDLAKQSN